MSSSSSYDSDYDEYEESEQEDEGSPENHFKILPTAVPLNFAVIMNPERIRAIRITDTRCALVRGKKNVSMLVKVISSANCPVDSVLVPKLLQFSLDVARDDSLCILPFDGKMQADAVQIVPLFDPGHTDYTSILTEYFSTDYHPVSVGSAFAIYVAGNVLNFRVLNILPTDRCIAWNKTRVVVITPQRAPPNATLLGRHFSDLAVTADVLNQVSKFIQLPVQHPALLKSIGLKGSNGVLIYGGKGAGKSSLLLAISRETKVPFLFVKIPDLMNLDPEQAMAKLHESFAYVLEQSPALLLLDDIQAMTRGLKSHKHVKERRLASTFVSLLDRCLADQGVVVVATATHHDDVDSSLHRLGRFAFEISLSDPLPAQRAQIITLNTVGVNIEPKDILKLSGKTTEKRTCADVANLTEIAVNRMIRRHCPNQEKRFVSDNDIFQAAQNTVEITDFPVELVNDETAEDFSLFGEKSEKPGSQKSDEKNLFSPSSKANTDLFGTSPKSPRSSPVPKRGSTEGAPFDTPPKSVTPQSSSDFFQLPPAKAQEAPVDPFGASSNVPVAMNPFATQPAKPLNTANPFATGSPSEADPFGVKKTEPQPTPPVIDPFAKHSTPKSDIDLFASDTKPAQQENAVDPFGSMSPTKPPEPAADPFGVGQQQPAKPPSSDPFSGISESAPFGSAQQAADPFAQMAANKQSQPASDPFASMGAAQPTQPVSDPFASMTGNKQTQPQSDPFASMASTQQPQSDPFASMANTQQPVSDPFATKQQDPRVATDFFRKAPLEPEKEQQAADPFANAQQQKPAEDPFGRASATSVFAGAPATDPFATQADKPQGQLPDPFAQSNTQLPSGFGMPAQAPASDPFANAQQDPFATGGIGQMQFGQNPMTGMNPQPFGFAPTGGGDSLRDMLAQGPVTPTSTLAGPPGGEMPEDAIVPKLTPEQMQSAPGNKGNESAMLAVMGISQAPPKKAEPEPAPVQQQQMGFPQQQQQQMGYPQQQQQMGYPQQQQMGFPQQQQQMGFPQQQQMGYGGQFGNQYGMGQQGFGQQMGGYQTGGGNPFGNQDPFNQPMQGYGYGGGQFGQSGQVDPFAQAGMGQNYGYGGADPFAAASMQQANFGGFGGGQRKPPEPDLFAAYDPINKK